MYTSLFFNTDYFTNISKYKRHLDDTLKQVHILSLKINIFNLLYSLLILHINYHHHELQQLLYKATIHLNSYLQELQSMIYFYEKIINKKRSIKCC